MKKYILTTSFKKLELDEKIDDNKKLIILLTEDEFKNVIPGMPHKKSLLHNISQTEYSKAELYGSCILGTLSVPVKKDIITEKIRIGFYIFNSTLYLIGDISQLTHLVGHMKEAQFQEDMSLPGFLCCLLNSWVDDDAIFIQKIEDALSDMEEKLLEQIPNQFYKMLIPYRKDIISLQSYYYQLLNIGITIRSNINQMLSDEDCLMFGYFSDRIDRLHSQVEMLREYMLHIREMYQTQIEVKQTKTMNLLTVVSAIFLPLTLLVGWYGMNFVYMPELKWTLGYPGVFILAVIIVCIEIIIFKKKRLI